MAMRLMEIASAEEQMALWKLINDNVWAAISQQARDEAERKAAAQRAAKLRVANERRRGQHRPFAYPHHPHRRKQHPHNSSNRNRLWVFSSSPHVQPPLSRLWHSLPNPQHVSSPYPQPTPQRPLHQHSPKRCHRNHSNHLKK